MSKAGSMMIAIAMAVSASPAFAWSSISFDEIERTTSVCTNHVDEFNAGTCSVAHCKGRCSIVSTFRGTCSAFATGDRDRHWYVTYDDDSDVAEEVALRRCENAGNTDCAVRRTLCDG